MRTPGERECLKRTGGSNPPLSASFIINNLQKQYPFGITFSHNRFKDIYRCSLVFSGIEMQRWTHPITVDNP